jgi:hypothetical protein
VSMDSEGKLTVAVAECTIGVDCCEEAKRKFKEDGKPYVQHSGLKCNGCGREAVRPSTEPTNGVSRKEHFRSLGQFALRSGPTKFPWSSSGRF